MCSIFGIIDHENRMEHFLKESLIQNLAIAAEIRGTDATGISYVQDGSIKVYKEPKAAHEINLRFPKGTKVIMGHTRMTTQGSETKNWNNHPFEGCCGQEEFALAHNGMLWNDKELRKEEHLPPTCIETDSYIAVQLLERSSELNMENVKSMAEAIQGSFMITVLRNDNTLFLVRGDNPITMYYIPALGIYAYASTIQILNDALKETGLEHCERNEVRINSEEIVAISEDSFVREDFTQKYSYSRYNRYNSGYGYYDYYEHGCYGWSLNDDDDDVPATAKEVTSITDLLYEYGSMYNVSKEEIDILLEFGYTSDDIEDMFMDHSLLDAALSEVLSYVQGGLVNV